MKDKEKSKEDLIADIAALRQRIVNLEKLDDQHSKLEKELFTCAERYHILFDNANDAIFVHAISKEQEFGVFVELNETACTMLGYSRDDLLKKNPLDILDLEERGTMKSCVQRLLDTQHAVIQGTFVTKDHKHVPVELS
ncbi:PAS domain S-box protein, partial [candidate division WOR-3 bacterium]|nr:PAS domain S-box protein [candidate division WOR-3 bacterium]